VKLPAASRGATCSAGAKPLAAKVESLRNPAKPSSPFLPVANHGASWRRRVSTPTVYSICVQSGALLICGHLRSSADKKQSEDFLLPPICSSLCPPATPLRKHCGQAFASLWLFYPRPSAQSQNRTWNPGSGVVTCFSARFKVQRFTVQRLQFFQITTLTVNR
jgi:hypothetical protein